MICYPVRVYYVRRRNVLVSMMHPISVLMEVQLMGVVVTPIIGQYILLWKLVISVVILGRAIR